MTIVIRAIPIFFGLYTGWNAWKRLSKKMFLLFLSFALGAAYIIYRGD